MSLSRHDSETLAKRDELPENEQEVIDCVFTELYAQAKANRVKAAGDDRAAKLEAALIRFIIESRE